MEQKSLRQDADGQAQKLGGFSLTSWRHDDELEVLREENAGLARQLQDTTLTCRQQAWDMKALQDQLQDDHDQLQDENAKLRRMTLLLKRKVVKLKEVLEENEDLRVQIAVMDEAAAYEEALRDVLSTEGPTTLSALGTAVKRPAAVPKLRKFIEESKSFYLDLDTLIVSLDEVGAYEEALFDVLSVEGPSTLSALGQAVKHPAAVPKLKRSLEEDKAFCFNPNTQLVSLA